MSKKVRLLWIGLAIGFIGTAATFGVIVGTGTLISRETEKTYAITEPFESVEFPETEHTTAVVEQSAGGYSLKAYVKAWRPEAIDIDKIVSFTVENGVLRIKDTPFADDLLGFFPQPYELRLTLYAPAEYFKEQIVGGAK